MNVTYLSVDSLPHEFQLAMYRQIGKRVSKHMSAYFADGSPPRSWPFRLCHQRKIYAVKVMVQQVNLDAHSCESLQISILVDARRVCDKEYFQF